MNLTTVDVRALGHASARTRIRRVLAVTLLVSAMISFVQSTPASAALVTSLSASVTGSGSVTVSWGHPTGALSDDYSYTVYFRESGTTDSYTIRQIDAGTSSAVLAGLTGGRTYAITVTASPTRGAPADVNSEGCNVTGGPCTSFDDAPSTSVTAATRPSPPTISGVVAASGQISVSFSAGNSNGSTVSQYTATCGALTETGTSSPIEVRGLTNGVAYTCTVLTGSNVGNSDSSAASESTTPSTTPDVMDPPTVSSGDSSVSVTWTALSATSAIGGADPEVLDDGGSAITGYTIRILNGATEVTTASAGASDSATTVTGLDNGTTYTAQIRGTNGVGSAAYSTSSAEFTPSTGGGTPSLSLNTQPGAVNSGVAFSGASRPVVNVGAAGVAVTAEVVSGATASGTVTVNSDGSGLATFSNLIVTRSTTGNVQLRFSATGYNSVTSSAFTVTVPPAGGGGDASTTTSSSIATTTTVRGATTTTVRSAVTTTTARAVTTSTTTKPTATSVPAVVITVPARFGTEVAALPQPASRVAADATVATRPGTLTVLVARPIGVQARAVARYVVTLTPSGGGRPTVRTITVTSANTVAAAFRSLNGRYSVSVTALNKSGKSLGTWKTPPIRVKR